MHLQKSAVLRVRAHLLLLISVLLLRAFHVSFYSLLTSLHLLYLKMYYVAVVMHIKVKLSVQMTMI